MTVVIESQVKTIATEMEKKFCKINIYVQRCHLEEFVREVIAQYDISDIERMVVPDARTSSGLQDFGS